MSGERSSTIEFYDRNAAGLAAAYEGLSAAEVWAPVQELIPKGTRNLALDIGAGSGRDAAWLSSLGLEVVAVEPSEGMRREGELRHPALRWLDDRLPGLEAVHRLSLSYDLILLSAVWMHLPLPERPRAFRKMVTLLKPGGLLIMTLRHGPDTAERRMHPVSAGEVEQLARDHGLTIIHNTSHPDRLERPEVSWTTICLRLPDDGSIGLPLIRGIILNDSKSSTYKLGLLRAVAKIADNTPSVAASSSTEDDRVLIPMGLVALNWIRGYLPLVRARLPQAPKNSGPDGLAFAKAGFRALLGLGVAPQELRVGASFSGERATALIAALGEACRTITTMPVHYTTLPNSAAPVFKLDKQHRLSERQIQRLWEGQLTLTPEGLGAWGHLSMPGPLWRTMQRFGTWIEPVLINEWARVIQGYATGMQIDLQPAAVAQHLVWLEPERDTRLARDAVARFIASGKPINCIWSGSKLRLETMDIDHALPWSAWPCGDLWNLFPASRRVNQHEKRDRLPSATALAAARDPITAWWSDAWVSDPALAGRFEAEVRAALPVEGELTASAIFSGLEWRRLRVQQDQQAPEWAGWRRPENR